MFVSILQIIIAILLVAAILLQASGSGLSPALGGGGGETYRTKRSAQKFLVTATVVLASALAILSITLLLLQK